MKRSMIQRAGKGLAALLLAVAVSTGVLPASAEAAEMSDFEAVFDAYSTGSGVNADMFGWQDIEESTLSAHWGVNTDGMLESTGGGNIQLLYTKETYSDFSMTFQYKHKADGERGQFMYVGFGAPKSGDVLGNRGGAAAESSPTVIRLHRAGLYSYAPTSNNGDAYCALKEEFAGEELTAVHEMTVSVSGSTLTLAVDGQSLGKIALTNYEGGHIFFGGGLLGDAFSLPEIEDTTPTNDFDGFSSYYTERVGSDKLASAELTDYWIEDEGVISRNAQTISGESGEGWNESANHLNNMAYLFIEGEYTDYENYTVELDYTLGSGGWRRAYIGFGATDDVSWREENGGSVFFTDDIGVVCFEGNLVENGTVQKDWFGHTNLDSFDAAASHHLKLTFQDGSITVEVDGQVVQTLENKAYYAGGRIFLASNSTGTKFENIQIKEIAAGENPGGGQTTPGGPDPDEGQEPDDDDESQTGEKNPNTGENAPIAAALLGLVAASAVIALKKRAGNPV